MSYPRINANTWSMVFVLVAALAVSFLVLMFRAEPVAEPTILPEYKIEPQVTLTARPDSTK
jgi:predicted Abi (CAAX) family protease